VECGVWTGSSWLRIETGGGHKIKPKEYWKNFTKVTLCYMVLSSPRTSTYLTSLHFTSKQNHFTPVTSVHSTSLHFTLHHLFTLNPHLNSLACN
jgi:hypothetical protein